MNAPIIIDSVHTNQQRIDKIRLALDAVELLCKKYRDNSDPKIKMTAEVIEVQLIEALGSLAGIEACMTRFGMLGAK